MNRSIMGIDPGGTSGVALLIEVQDTKVYSTFACTDPQDLYRFIRTNKDNLNAIVIERFTAETISKDGLHTVRIVGGVQALCTVYNIPLIEHMPSDRWPFKKEARQILKGRKVVVHEQDALEHVLRWEYDNAS